MTNGKLSIPHGMYVRDVYARLNSLEPGFLKRGVIRYAKSSGLYAETLGGVLGQPTLRFGNGPTARCAAHPKKRILNKTKRPLKKD